MVIKTNLIKLNREKKKERSRRYSYSIFTYPNGATDRTNPTSSELC